MGADVGARRRRVARGRIGCSRTAGSPCACGGGLRDCVGGRWYIKHVPECCKRRPNTKCARCGKPVYRRPSVLEVSRGRAFCSQRCYGIACRKEKPCIVCGAPILAGANKKTCSRSCANKRRAGIRYKIGSPRDKVRDQRAVKQRLLALRGAKCERCNYARYEILQVHHNDRDRDNNALENLTLLCPNCHAEEHYLEQSWLRRDEHTDGGVFRIGKEPVLKTGARKGMWVRVPPPPPFGRSKWVHASVPAHLNSALTARTRSR